MVMFPDDTFPLPSRPSFIDSNTAVPFTCNDDAGNTPSILLLNEINETTQTAIINNPIINISFVLIFVYIFDCHILLY